jgi:hypothetical protein
MRITAGGLVVMKRWTLLLFLVLLRFTMAPRTSDLLPNGWAYTARDSGGMSQANTTTYTIKLTQHLGPATGDLVVDVDPDGAWALVAAPRDCTTHTTAGGSDALVCPVEFDGKRTQHTLSVTVRTPKGTQASFSPSSLEEGTS